MNGLEEQYLSRVEGAKVNTVPEAYFHIIDGDGILIKERVPANRIDEEMAKAEKENPGIDLYLDKATSAVEDRALQTVESSMPYSAEWSKGKASPGVTGALKRFGSGVVAGARDLSSATGQALARMYGEPGDIGKTSEEYSSEGRLGKSILTSPAIVPSVATAILTGGSSIPYQIGGQVASNMVFMPEYGTGDVALDAVLTALPPGLNVLASKTKAAGMAAIRKALESKVLKNVSESVVEEAYNRLSKVRVGKKVVQESGEALAKDLAKPAPGASDVPKSGLLRNLSRGAPVEIPTAAFDRARKSILASVKAKGGRSLDEAREVISRVDAMEATQKRIAALQEEGGYATEAYTRDIVDALKKVADIPELVREAEGYISTAAESRAKDEVQRILSAAFNRPPGLLANSVPDASFSQPLENLRAGTALQEIYGGSGRGILDVVSEPTITARGLARHPTGKLLAEKGLRGTGAAAPSILNRLYYREGENQ